MNQRNWYSFASVKDPQYNDQHQIEIIQKFTPRNTTFSDDYLIFDTKVEDEENLNYPNLINLKHFQKINDNKCKINGTISIKNSVFEEKYFDFQKYLNEEDVFKIDLYSKDENCQFSIEGTASYKKPTNKFHILGYILFNIILYALNLWGCHNIVEKIREDTNNSMRYSLFIVEFAVA